MAAPAHRECPDGVAGRALVVGQQVVDEQQVVRSLREVRHRARLPHDKTRWRMLPLPDDVRALGVKGI